MKLKDHPFYERLRTASPQEVSSWVIEERDLVDATKEERKEIFKAIGRQVIVSRNERKKYGFNSNSSAEIARALEWAFKAGLKSKKKE